MNDFLRGVIIGLGIVFGVYFFSRLQMQAWFHEFNKQLDKKLKDKFNKLKNEKDEEGKE
jgi:hypothetical protein